MLSTPLSSWTVLPTAQVDLGVIIFPQLVKVNSREIVQESREIHYS